MLTFENYPNLFFELSDDFVADYPLLNRLLYLLLIHQSVGWGVGVGTMGLPLFT
jgi:hypothetical protein